MRGAGFLMTSTLAGESDAEPRFSGRAPRAAERERYAHDALRGDGLS